MRLLAERTSAQTNEAPCSYSQRSLWFMYQLAPESPVYNVPSAWRIRSIVDADAMHRAIRQLVQRHEALRTTYENRDGAPWQRVHRELPDGFEARDVGAINESELSALLQADAARPFDLINGPIFRATLYTRTETDHVMLVAVHHIASDMWTIEQILSELRVLYLREANPGASTGELPPIRATYRDFSAWQRDMLAGPDGEEHWNYWRSKLGGPLPRLELPLDRPRPRVQSFVGGGFQIAIPSELAEEARRRARAENATLYPLFLATFQALLARYSGQDDILVGSVTTGRSRSEFETVLGYFVNPIIFRTNLSDDPTFRDLLQRTRVDTLAALDHQDYPFALLVERLNVERDPSRPPLSDVYFVWDRSRETEEQSLAAGTDDTTARLTLDWGGVSLESVHLSQVGTPSDLTLVVFDFHNTLTLNIGYSVDLFDRPTIERMAQHYMTMLRAVIADPDLPVSRIPMATPSEREALLRWTPAPDLASLDGQSLHRRFEAQARRRPEAVAVSGASGHITYGALDRQATRLAARLRDAGLERGATVGLFVERDGDMAVAILAILKAGGAYLPIDRAYPDDRAAFMLEDSGTKLLVSQRSLASALPGVTGVNRIFVDDDPAVEPPDFRSADLGPDDVAYVIYTSGSTGKPKGVMVTHRNVMRLLDATDPWFHFSDRDVWSLFHSIAFDFSVWELWGALLYGGRVVIVPYRTTRSPEDLLDLIANEQVTILSQTPSAFRQLIAADAARGATIPLALRFVIFGGEALDVNMLQPWFDRRGDTAPQLVNMYGITETTVHTTYRPISAADLNLRVRSPIGVPIPDLHLHVFDAAGEPVPIGVPGELYVGGAGVARGYLNRPELTETRFIADHTSTEPGARLYRSGDLVRRLMNGDIEYLGRIDHQVKVRGFRIELGEIETALVSHPSVDHCAVVLKRDADGEPRIVAYVVATAGEDIASGEMQAFIRRSLPDYMVPSAFVKLSALPLTSNHKLDVNALPSPDLADSPSTRPFTPPRTPLELEIAAEWQRILGVERVGADDDFFELGGHSILATRVARWMREQYQIDFPVYAVFESPTVGQMADRVQALAATAVATPMPSSQPREEFEL
jgi:amino acid adenylation domain-containing protein